MTLEPRRPGSPVGHEDAARIFRRAAELERHAGRRPSADGLGDTELIEIGREVGLSPEAIRRAIGEFRAGSLPTDDDRERRSVLGPRTVTVERTVARPPERVHRDLHAWLGDQLFTPVRDTGAWSAWLRRDDVGAKVRRAFQSRTTALRDVSRLEISLVGDPDEAATHVRIEAGARQVRTGLTVAASGGTVAGLGGGLTAGALTAVVGPDVLAAVPVLGGAGVAAGSWWAARASWRRTRRSVGLVLEGLLDHLAGAPEVSRRRG